MKYQVGDKVKLKNGSIITIREIAKSLDNMAYVYGYPIKCIVAEDEILCKIED